MANPMRGFGNGLGGWVGGGKVMKEGYEVVKRKVGVLDVDVGQSLSFLSCVVSK